MSDFVVYAFFILLVVALFVFGDVFVPFLFKKWIDDGTNER